MPRFQVLLVAAGNRHIEQMDLVVACDAFTVRIDQQGRVRDPAVRCDFDIDRSAQNPHLELARGVGQELLHRTIAIDFRDAALVDIAEADEREIFRQTGNFRTGVFCLVQELAGDRQVIGDDMTRGHLNCCDAAHYVSSMLLTVRHLLPASFGAPAVAALAPLLTRSMLGFSQVPPM